MSAATKLLWLDTSIGAPRSLATGDTVDAPGDWTFSEDVVITNNLTVNGTTTSINTENVLIEDRFTLHNSNYTTDTAVTAGIVFNVDPAATSFSVVTSSNAGLAAAGGVLAGDSGFTTTADPTVALAVGDIIIVTGTNDVANNGIYEVKGVSTAPNQVAIKTAPDASVQGIVQTSVVTNAVAGGTLVQAGITVIRADSNNTTVSIGTGDATPIVFTPIQTVGAVTLQVAYENGNTINATGAEGNIAFTLTSADFTVNGANDVDLGGTTPLSTFNVDTTGTITVDSSAAGISLDAVTASNFTVTGAADLTLSSTLGSVIASSGEAAADAIRIVSTNAAGGIDMDAGTAGLDVDTTGQVNLASSQVAADAIRIVASAAAGGVDIDAGSAGINATSTGGIVVVQSGGGPTEIRTLSTETSAILSLVNTTNTSSLFTGTSNPNGTVTGLAGSLFLRDTGSGGELYVNTSTGSGTAWTLLSTAGATTLQSAYEAGNTITTSVGEGNVTINGTENFVVGGSVDVDFDTTGFISLDADLASNFSVAGAGIDLTLSSAGGQVIVDGGEAAANAVRIVASNVAGGIDVDAGTGGIDITSTGDIAVTMPASSATGLVIDDGTTTFLTFDSTDNQTEQGAFLDTGTNVGQGTSYANNTGSTISAGKLVTTDTNATLQIKEADATSGGATNLTSRITGVVTAAILTGASGKVHTTYGVPMNVVFTGAVVAADQGRVAYLDTTGNATLTAPSASGDFVVEVGIVQGANAGAGTAARVLFAPRFVAAIA